ncbi:MAG: 1-phosphofructokinase [Cellulosilyticaceae bacterium]
MISTVTLNPSIDYLVKVDHFKVDAVNRTQEEQMFPGGKGINVSIVLSNLGIPNKALGFIAGFTGVEITRMVEASGVSSEFIQLEKGLSRINVKLKSDEETEINGNGPEITSEHICALYAQIEALTSGDVLVLAGSIPSTVPSDIYQQIMHDFAHKNLRIVVDATKDLLMNVLPLGPFLIKPNHHELGELFGVTIKDQDEVVTYAKKLQEKGARNVLVSMAGDGAVLVTEDGQVMKHTGLKGQVKNSVGAGDSMVAGFVAGYVQTEKFEEAFKMGIAAGSASAFSVELATRIEVEALLGQLSI